MAKSEERIAEVIKVITNRRDYDNDTARMAAIELVGILYSEPQKVVKVVGELKRERNSKPKTIESDFLAGTPE